MLPSVKCLCSGPESNQRHVDFQSTALPTELPERLSSRKLVYGRRVVKRFLWGKCRNSTTLRLRLGRLISAYSAGSRLRSPETLSSSMLPLATRSAAVRPI